MNWGVTWGILLLSSGFISVFIGIGTVDFFPFLSGSMLIVSGALQVGASTPEKRNRVVGGRTK